MSVWLAAGLLALVTLTVYWPATHCDFINCDDDVYLTNNPRLLLGLTWDNVQWYFGHFYFSNWHPVTSLSYLLDFELWGLKPFGFHLTNILLHALNTVLVFLVLRELMAVGIGHRGTETQSNNGGENGHRSAMSLPFWRCALVAALFGLHPLHVESVAWVAERKDVLSGCFGLLTLWAYAKYVRNAKCGMRSAENTSPPAQDKDWGAAPHPAGGHLLPSAEKESPHLAPPPPPNAEREKRSQRQDAEMLQVFHGGKADGPLSSKGGGGDKLDLPAGCRQHAGRGFYWLALGCFALGLMSKPMLVTWPFVLLLLDFWPLGRFTICDLRLTIWRPLLVEKIPFFVLAAASCVVTYLAQHQGGALIMTDAYPLEARIGNALVSYGRYLGKTFWPSDLAIFYPHPGEWPIELVLLAAAVLGVSSWWCWRQRWQQPFWLTGWLWFLGTLVPVIGLVQAGEQAMADRYMYLPLLGVLIVVVWGALELAVRLRQRKVILTTTGLALIALCAGVTWRQLGHWRNSEAIFRQALAATKDNAFAQNDLGIAVMNRGEFGEAIAHFKEAARLKPAAAEIHNNLGQAYLNNGELDEAIAQLQEAILWKPWYAPAHANLGLTYFKQGNMSGATREFEETLRLKPDFIEARINLGVARLQKGEVDAAAELFEAVLKLKPNDSNTHFNLAVAYFRKGQLDEALGQFQEAARLAPEDGECQARLKLLTELQRNLELATNNPGLLNNIAWELATSPSVAVRSGGLAVQLAERACELTQRQVTVMLGTLAAAYAEAGRFDDAVATADQACALAKKNGETELLKRNEELRELYQKHQPYREKP